MMADWKTWAIIGAVALFALQTCRLAYSQWQKQRLSVHLSRVIESGYNARLMLVEQHAEQMYEAHKTHSREREQMKTDLLLQHDATLRNILTSFERGLLNKLGESETSSDASPSRRELAELDVPSVPRRVR